MSIAITILSSLISGVVGVLIGVWLNRYYEAKQSKTDLLKTLITYRFDASSPERTNAINCIPIVFCKDARVCGALDLFKKAHDGVTENLFNPVVLPQKCELLNDSYIKLVEEIAKNLGLESSLSWDKLKKPYLPNYFNDPSGIRWY